MNIVKTLDLKGLNCPLPLLKTKKALSELQSMDCIEVFATDPASVKDFQAFSKQSGHELLSSDKLESYFRFVLKKK